MPDEELQRFLNAWDAEAQKTIAMLRTLPAGQYDFRPDTAGRSLGELAWHLAEVDAYVSYGVEQGQFASGTKPPGIERPRSIEALAPGYERIHSEAAARVRRLGPADLELLFDRNLDRKYERALSKIGINPSHLVSEAGHA